MLLPGLSRNACNDPVVSPKALTLCDLNYDVLHHILSFVLSLDAIKESASSTNESNTTTPTTRPAPRYHFHTAIMRTNKQLHRIGRYVLASNHLIRFTVSDTSLFNNIFGPTSCALPPPMFWTRNVDSAVDVCMEISITRRKENNPPNGTLQGESRSGLIFLEHLQHWVESVMSHELLFWDEFTLDTHCQHSLGPKLQHKLLMPLMALRSFSQVCLMDDFPWHMPTLYWARASAFNLYDCVLAYSKRGDAAYKAGDFDMAADIYSAILRHKDIVLMENNRQEVLCTEKDDPVLMRNLELLVDAITANNIAVLMFLSKYEDASSCMYQWAERRGNGTVYMDADVRGLLGFFGVIDKLFCRATIVAEMIEEMAEHVESWPVLSPAVEVIQEWSELSVDEKFGSEACWRKPDTIDRLMNIVPRAPMTAKLDHEPGYSSTIEREHYILRALGYQGPLFEERVYQHLFYDFEDQELSYTFDKVQADKDIEIAKQKIESQISAGKAPTLWLRSMLAKNAWEEPADLRTDESLEAMEE